jgi:trehalose/maltose hydrolase-like predicted phosphorylase
VRIWTGDIEIHISADVAYAIMQYWRVTGDDAFMRDYGAEMILETARFWADRAEPEEVTASCAMPTAT